MSALERGDRRRPQIDTVRALASALNLPARGRDELMRARVVGGSQVEGAGEGANRLGVGPSSLTAFQRAHGMNRETGNRRELVLRVARRLAKGLELHPK